jgi:septum formation protein
MAHRTDIDSTRTDVVTSNVTMRNMTDDEIAVYVASGEPFGKAGGYGIQDRTFRPVERLDGCYTNVVGFPMCIVTRLLHARKFEIAVTLCSPKHLPCIYEPRD